MTRERVAGAVVGAVFGIILCWSGMANPDVIRSALLFEQAYLFLFFASAVATAVVGLRILRRVRERAVLSDAPIGWSAYPVAYLLYALVRGQAEHKYPYPFLDVGKIGWTQTALNVGGIALGFILAGFALVWFDRWRPLGSNRSTR